MYPNPAKTGVKRHILAHSSDDFPHFGRSYLRNRIQYPDLTWKETCGMMANLVGDSGCNKGQLSYLVEALCRDFRTHDDNFNEQAFVLAVLNDLIEAFECLVEK